RVAPAPAAAVHRRRDERSVGNTQVHLDVAAGGVGVRAHLVCLLDQRLQGVAGEPRRGHRQRGLQAEATAQGADAHVGGDRGRGRQRNLLLAGDELQRAQEAGRVAGGEQLLRVGAFAARAAQLARRGQGEVELAVGGGGAAFAAAGGGGGAGVEDLLEGHGGLLSGVGRRGASGKAYCAHRPPR